MIENASELCAGIGALSATITVKFDVPRLVGVPLREPALGSSVSPAGRLPAEMLQCRGSRPPVALKLKVP